MRNPDEILREVRRHAERLAARLSDDSHARPAPDDGYRELLALVRELDPRFAFDRDGRPAAIEAVRNALPMMERDLFDAILEDVACELAAAEEALRQVVRANGRQST